MSAEEQWPPYPDEDDLVEGKGPELTTEDLWWRYHMTKHMYVEFKANRESLFTPTIREVLKELVTKRTSLMDAGIAAGLDPWDATHECCLMAAHYILKGGTPNFIEP